MSKRVKIADLKFDPENARVRTAKGEAMIQESLRQVGAARSIVIDEDGIILAGNGTVEAAGQIGIDNVVIVEASGDEIIAVRRVEAAGQIGLGRSMEVVFWERGLCVACGPL